MTPCIIHMDIDAFFASVEQVRNPHLRGRPVIVGSGVIASCSYEARRFGLRAGMPLAQARELCPQAVVLEGHYPTYRCFSDRIFELCRDLAPQVDAYLDEAYCDLTGTQTLYGCPESIAASLKEMIHQKTGLTVSVGVGTTRTIAKIAGGLRKPDGLVVVTRDQQDQFLGELPVEKLPGVGPCRKETLARLNIHTVGELRDLGVDYLESLFGENGRVIYDRSCGQDTGWIEEKKIPQSISRETAFHTDTCDPNEVEGMLYYLTERAARTLRSLGVQTRRINVRIRYADAKGTHATHRFPVPTDLDTEMFNAGREILWKLYARRVSLHAIGLELSSFSRPDGQPNLFGPTRADELANLYRGIDELRNRFGHSVIVVGKCLEAVGKLRKDRYGYILRTPCLTK